MSNEKENEMVDQSSSSDDDCWAERLKHKLDHPVVDVREYVISFGKAGIQRTRFGSRTKSIKIIATTRTVLFT